MGEWNHYRLGELGETYTGLIGKTKDDFGNGKPFIPYKNIFYNATINPEWLDYVQVSEGERQYRVQYGDIFFTTSSETPDEVGMSSVLLDDLGECYLNSFCFGFRLHDFSVLLPQYARYLFRGEDFRRQMYELSQGSTRFNLSKRELLKSELVLPPLAEQQKIAEILSTWDEAIALTEQLIDALERRKKGLAQRLIGRAGWEEVRFEEVLEIEMGGTPSRSEPAYWDVAKETANVWLSISDLNGKYVYDSAEYISDAGVSNSSVVLFSAGTVLMSFKLTIGRAAIADRPVYTNEAICGLLPKDFEQLDPMYLFHALSEVRFDREIDQAVKGKTLNKSKLKRLRLPYPDYQTQRYIADILDTADRELELYRELVARYREQKTGLMQRLLTGQVRVTV